MSDFKTEELDRQFPVKVSCIMSITTFSSLYDANAVVLERLPTAKPDIALWTVSVPARDSSKGNLFGVVLDSRQEMIPVNRAFYADKKQLQPLIDVCTTPETVSIVERIKTADEASEFGPVSGPDVLLGFNRDWKGQRPRDFDFLLLDRRSRDRAAGNSVRLAARNWEPPFFQGDSEAVTQEAFARLARRRERYGWVILRSEDTETAAELTVLTDFLKEHVPDFEVPQIDLHGSTAKAGKVVYSRKILPFYKHHRLYEIFDHRHARPRRTRFLFSPGTVGDTERLIPLAGIFVPIPDLTEQTDGKLSGDELVEYVAFHCDHVAGKNGNPFSVVETTEDLSWRTHQHGSQIQNLLASIFPLRLWPEPAVVQAEQDEAEATPEGQTVARTRLVDGFVRYDAGFSHVVYSVQPDGKIDMIEGDQILRALPARLSLLDFDNQFLLKQSVR